MKDRMGNEITERDYSWVRPLMGGVGAIVAVGALALAAFGATAWDLGTAIAVGAGIALVLVAKFVKW